MRALITDKAYNWASHAKYDEKAVFQDLTNDLKRYQAANHPEDLPLTNTDKQVFQSTDAPTASQDALSATPGGTLCPSGVKDMQHTGSASGAMPHSTLQSGEMVNAADGLPSLKRSQSDTRPVNHSACPTLWGYSRQQAISKTTAPSMASAKANSQRLKSQIINNAPVGAPPTCVDCNTFLAGALDSKLGTRSGKGGKAPSEPSSFALKRGYIYVPPQVQGSTAPKPIYAKAMLSQTSYIPAADSSAETLWRKQWNVSCHQHDYTLNRKPTDGVGPLAPTYWSEADSGARFTVTYGNKIGEMPEGSGSGPVDSKLRYVPRDVPNAPKSASLTAPIGQMFSKTDSLRWGLTGGKPYLRNITEENIQDTMTLERELKYDDRTTHRKSYIPMSDMAKDAAANDHAECVRLWREQYTKPCPVPKGAPLPMETTQQVANRIATMNNELTSQREEASLRKRLQEETGVLYKPPYAGEWAQGLPERRMHQLDALIQAVKLDPDQNE